MDGLKRKMTQSLQVKLSAWLSSAILGVALLAGVFSFLAGFHEANEMQDYQLQAMAALVDSHHLPLRPDARSKTGPDGDPESRFVLQTLPVAATDLSWGLQDPRFPSNLRDGIQTVKLGKDEWRAFVKTLDSGSRIVVGQQTAVRDDLARDSVLRTLMPFLILIPILLILVGNLIGQMFKPLKCLAADLDQRPHYDLQKVDEQEVPSEIRPFLVAINRLLSRVAASVDVQRRFVADAAHELRSPLTALSLQAERLEAAEMSTQARQRLATLREGLRRTRSLVEQLLALARAEHADSSQASDVSVQKVFREVLEDLMPLAQVKNIDLGVVGQSDAKIQIQELDLKTLVKNIVENAIRFTPAGGRVDLSVQTNSNRVVMQIEDNGPGIAETERERVFDSFYRVLGHDEAGSGLGLSIVKAIADRVGAEVRLCASSMGPKMSGLRVTVMFPIL